MKFDDKFPWMTFLILILALIIVAVGGAVVIMGNLTFETYLDDLEKFAIGIGLVAVGRGVQKSVIHR